MVLTHKKHELSMDDLQRLTTIIHENVGIKYSENKKYLLESRLSKRLRELRLSNFKEYLDIVSSSSKGSSEITILINAITTNETSFFRNEGQLYALTDFIVPEILKRKTVAKEKSLKIWSAASSTGEEPYSIAMALHHKKVVPAHFRSEIVGSDINKEVLKTAKAGIYSHHSLRKTPQECKEKYFTEIEDTFKLKPLIKSMVSFREVNLIDMGNATDFRNADIIYCANVMIYFSKEAKIKAIDNMYENLAPGGYFIVGHAESLHNLSKHFRLVNANGIPIYKKKN